MALTDARWEALRPLLSEVRRAVLGGAKYAKAKITPAPNRLAALVVFRLCSSLWRPSQTLMAGGWKSSANAKRCTIRYV
ncbi:hypothetical protein GCM10011504_47830 [Siccirubricoccus deserti]|nr:hypothetical protein GCM10011504_47830 [Siccirubricoccus deserti]